jgi:sugar phosphate isomerase/epimerase
MKHLVSISALHKLDVPLTGLVDEFTQAGFDGISCDPEILLGLDTAAFRNLMAVVAERNMVVALHGGFSVPVADLTGLAQRIGQHLATVTFDPDLGWTSAGLIFSMEKMGPYLVELDRCAVSLGFKFGIEDFPETPFALKMYQDSFLPLLESDQFGILIDLGHFNLSVNQYGYFKGISPEDHLGQLPLKLLEIHLSDNDGQDDQHHPLGMGIIQYESVARGLNKIGFDGLSTIEIDPRENCSKAEATQDVLSSFSYWKNILDVASKQYVQPIKISD